jgi:glutamate synthase domain-containing protein 2/rubredoxin
MIYTCDLCSHEFDSAAEGTTWDNLPADWMCPICGSPKSAFVPSGPPTNADESADAAPPTSSLVRKYQCGLCSQVYDDGVEELAWEDLLDDWACPVCGSPTSDFHLIEESAAAPVAKTISQEPIAEEYLGEWRRPSDDREAHMADIHRMARTGHSIIEPMRASGPLFSWDEILVQGAQVAKLPLNRSQPVSTRTVIGPQAKTPLTIETPILISHMSYGALSPEAKQALSKGSAAVKTAMSSGEGGILPESLDNAHKYIFEYVPHKYSVTDEYLGRVDAVEIKIGQSAKPGMGGHLPGDKVTREIAAIRGFREGSDIISPSHFPDIRTPAELKKTVDKLRDKTSGKPIGLKLAAGNIEADLEVAVAAGVDFVTLDGRAGGTGAAPKFIKASASVPTIFALARARKFLDDHAADISLIITGGTRISADFAKALALGADAVAIGTAAMMAIGCQQYRICNTGKCPIGIATQDPALRARLDVDRSATMLANFLRSSTEELEDFARLTGNDSIHNLSVGDLCTTNSELSNHTPIAHV